MPLIDRIQRYRDSKALSQSDIKAILYHPSVYRAEKEKDNFTDGLLIGGAVDILLTHGAEEFNKNYYAMDIPITGTMRSIVDEAFRALNRDWPNWPDDERLINDVLLETAINEGYQSNWKTETIANKVCIEDNVSALRQMSKASGKIVITGEQLELIQNVAHSLQTHFHTQDYFNLEGEKHIRVEKQVAIYFVHNNVACKALLDMIIINDTDKDFEKGLLKVPAKSVLPIDIKTTGEHTVGFQIAVKRFRYDIQGAWYSMACERAFKGYSIMPFRFVVESTKSVGCPLVYIMTENDMRAGRYGLRSPLGYDIPGFEKGVEDFKWYMNSGKWDYPRYVYEQDGHIELDVYGSEEQNSEIPV